MPPSPPPCDLAVLGFAVRAGGRRDSAVPIVQNEGMVHVPQPMIEDLRHELAEFKNASGAAWASAAVHLAGAVEALLDETEPSLD